MKRGRPRKVRPKSVNVAFSCDVEMRQRMVAVVDNTDYKSLSDLMRKVVLSALPGLEQEAGIHTQISLFSDNP